MCIFLSYVLLVTYDDFGRLFFCGFLAAGVVYGGGEAKIWSWVLNF